MRLRTCFLGLLQLVQLIGRRVNIFMEGRARVQDRPAVRWWRATGQARGDSWGRQRRSLSFECKSSRVEELADVRKALVYLYRLVNRATSCETGDRLDLRRISHWEPIWTTQTAEGLFSFWEFQGRNVALIQATTSSPFAVFTIFSCFCTNHVCGISSG